MRTAAIGGGLARERQAAGPSMHTHVPSTLAVVSNEPRLAHRGWLDPIGSEVSKVERFNLTEVTQRGGFEWTGKSFPLRIPTAVKARVARKYRELLVHLRRVHPRDWLSLISVASVLLLAWSLLWS